MEATLSEMGKEKLNQINTLAQTLGLEQLTAGAFIALDLVSAVDTLIEKLQLMLAVRTEAMANEEKPEPEEPSFEEILDDAFNITEDIEDVAEMLGHRYLDNISALVGTVVSVCQDLDGSINCLLQPKCLEDNKLPERVWVEHSRLVKV